MKSILLATASIVAFAGAAAAQQTGVTFGGEAELGFNDVEEDGFFYSADLNVTFQAELDNGLTTSVTFTIPVADNATDASLGTSDFVLALEADDVGGLYFGDTEVATEAHWDPGFAMASDGFTEQDNETVLRGTGVFGGVSTSVSGIVRDGGNDRPGLNTDERDYIDQIAVGASGTVGAFTFNFAYQEESQLSDSGDDETVDGDLDISEDLAVYDSSNEDFNADEVLGIAAGATFGGADVKFAYSRNFTDFGTEDPTQQGTNSYGVLVRYPFGPVSAYASYTFEPDYDENSFGVGGSYTSGPISASLYYESEVGDEEVGVEATYNPSDLTTYAIGYINDIDNDGIDIDGEQDEGFYVQAKQALGSNAYVSASYAEFGDAGPDEVREGTTLLVGFAF